jgi:CheY-like chemotaxis protein
MIENSRALSVLLVEDDPGDQELIRRGLQGGAVRVELHVIDDGELALDWLFGRGDSVVAGRAWPDLILLDLNLPRLSGREVLKRLKEDDRLRRVPVIVLTTSEHERDVLQSFRAGADAYIVKPTGMEKFAEMIRSVADYGSRLQAARPESPDHAAA